MDMPAAGGSISIELSDVWDPTIISIWKRIYSFLSELDIVAGMLVCRSFCQELPSLVTSIIIGDDGDAFGQRQLAHLAKTFTSLESLTIEQEYSDSVPRLDFRKVQLPALVHLQLSCRRIKTCSFTQHNTPKLQSLSIDGCEEFAGFDLDLPDLTSISFEHAQVGDSSNFGPSLSKCPKLKSFSAYKLWGLSGGIHKLDLPECESFALYRSDDLEALEVKAPKLVELSLRACYSLAHVRLLDDPADTQPKSLLVNLINANIDRVSRRHLKQHPRVAALWTKPEHEDGDYGSGGSEDDDEDDDGADEYHAMLIDELAQYLYGNPGDEDEDEDEEDWESESEA